MKNLYILLILATALAIVALIARSGVLARKNPGEPMSAAMRAAMSTPQLSTQDARFIAENYPAAHTNPSGLRYLVLTPGAGETARPGQRVITHYTGTFLNGEKFDSSRDRNEPFALALGVDRVIAGWTEALGAMRKGERRLLIIPWWLAYGEKGKGEAIPPRSTLVFDVEILDIQ